MRARKGMTLIEVMLAGAITVLFTLSLMEALIVAAKISNENSQLLAADAYAWDTAWKWFNKKFDDLDGTTGGKVEFDVVSSNDCPMLCSALTGGDAQWAVKSSLVTMTRHGVETKVKLIEVNVAWGPASDRKSLNGMFGNKIQVGTKNYSHPVSIYKSDLDRGEL